MTQIERHNMWKSTPYTESMLTIAAICDVWMSTLEIKLTSQSHKHKGCHSHKIIYCMFSFMSSLWTTCTNLCPSERASTERVCKRAGTRGRSLTSGLTKRHVVYIYSIVCLFSSHRCNNNSIVHSIFVRECNDRECCHVHKNQTKIFIVLSIILLNVWQKHNTKTVPT